MFRKNVLDIQVTDALAQIERTLREQVLGTLRRKGIVVGLSGGIDSSVVAALAVRALGKEKVLGLFMPERDSSGDSLRLGKVVAETLGIESVIEDIGPVVAAAGCYDRQVAAIRTIYPEYDERWKCKVTLPSILDSDRFNVSQLTVLSPAGETKTSRLTPSAYLQLVAATNFKQRTRKMLEYYHADRLNYAVAGTPNRLEYDQGFFVKLGDGAADVKPIAALYKTQVYALARHLGVIEEIVGREPTTDTYTLEQSQEDFYYSLHYSKLDLFLWAKNRGLSAESVAAELGYSPDQVRRVYDDIDQKRRATQYLHARPLLLDPVDEVP